MSQPSMEQSPELLKAILDTVVDGIITINDRGVIQSLNPAAEKIFGYRSDELIGEKINVLMPSPYREEHDGYLENYHRTNQPKIIGIGREVEGKRRDGTVFPLYLAVSGFEHNGKKYYSGLVRDITDLKQYRDHLEDLVMERTQKVEDESAEEERRRIGGDLHDALGQHMTGIAYLAETLSNQVSDSDPEAARLADRIAELLKETLEQTRRLVRGLYPVDSGPEGLRTALEALTQRLSKDFRLESVFDCPEDFVFADSNAANHLFRIAHRQRETPVPGLVLTGHHRAVPLRSTGCERLSDSERGSDTGGNS